METDTSAKTNSGNTAMSFTSLVVILGLLCLTTQISLRFFAAGVALSVKLYQAIVYLCVKVCLVTTLLKFIPHLVTMM